MIKSMTGYGKAVTEWENKKITVEIRSLNSKQLDLNLRIPGIYREKELEIRSLAIKEAERGRIDLSVYIESAENENSIKINTELARNYFNELRKLAASIGAPEVDLLSLVLKLPDVLIKNERPELDEQEWKIVTEAIQKAFIDFNKFRMKEGGFLELELVERINNILNLLKEVETFDPIRIKQVKERLQKHLNELTERESIDQNRFEQELIYYLEKLDITEERVRLKTHCNYFFETIENSSTEGRKLGFISQEIGREINTIGSKANDAMIQKIVVQMKDELEKIKEQLLNVL